MKRRRKKKRAVQPPTTSGTPSKECTSRGTLSPEHCPGAGSSQLRGSRDTGSHREGLASVTLISATGLRSLSCSTREASLKLIHMTVRQPRRKDIATRSKLWFHYLRRRKPRCGDEMTSNYPESALRDESLRPPTKHQILLP